MLIDVALVFGAECCFSLSIGLAEFISFPESECLCSSVDFFVLSSAIAFELFSSAIAFELFSMFSSESLDSCEFTGAA